MGVGEVKMKIDNTVTSNVQNVGIAESSKDAGHAKDISDSASVPSTSVSLSGKAIMLSRLFGAQNTASEPPVVSGVNGMDLNNIGMSPQNFLTTSDRALLSDMYEYAQQQGADLKNVDALAYQLGNYRQHNDGHSQFSVNDGNSFDSEGHLRTFSFTEKDAATATRILNSDAINSTRLDHGFVRFILDPGYGAAHTNDFEFMEQMINKFSDKGSEMKSLDPKFSTFTGVKSVVDNMVIHTSKDVTNPPFKPQIINDNGKWIVLDPAALGDNSFEQATAQQKMKSAVNLNEMIINNAFPADDQKTSKSNSLTNLLNQIGKSNATKKL